MAVATRPDWIYAELSASERRELERVCRHAPAVTLLRMHVETLAQHERSRGDEQLLDLIAAEFNRRNRP